MFLFLINSPRAGAVAYLAFSTIFTRRQRFIFDSGRVSMNRYGVADAGLVVFVVGMELLSGGDHLLVDGMGLALLDGHHDGLVVGIAVRRRPDVLYADCALQSFSNLPSSLKLRARAREPASQVMMRAMSFLTCLTRAVLSAG